MLNTIVAVGQTAGELYVSIDWKTLTYFVGFVGQSIITVLEVRHKLKSTKNENEKNA